MCALVTGVQTCALPISDRQITALRTRLPNASALSSFAPTLLNSVVSLTILSFWPGSLRRLEQLLKQNCKQVVDENRGGASRPVHRTGRGDNRPTPAGERNSVGEGRDGSGRGEIDGRAI